MTATASSFPKGAPLAPTSSASLSALRSASSTGFAMVKAVPSGDTVVLLGAAQDGRVGPEKQLTLTGILAPRFGRGPKATDEPFAFDSREFLRHLCVGQQVSFTVLHQAESGREYGSVLLRGANLAELVVSAGWAKVKEGSTDKQGNVRAEYAAITQLQQEAEANQIGLWQKTSNSKEHIRHINFNPDVNALVQQYKGQPLAGVIDRVLDGSTMRVELTELEQSKPLHHTMIQVCLAGVQCARTPLPLNFQQQQYDAKVAANAAHAESEDRPSEESQAEALPFALEAQHFTEARLLNRDVQVVLFGADKSGNLYGNIQFAKGNISLKLLELGYGKLVQWSAALTQEAQQLAQAQAQAQAKKLRVWQNYKESAVGDVQAGSSYEAKVVQVQSGDSLTLADSNGAEIRVVLASVRCPRLAGRRGDRPDEPLAQQAKEFVRSRLIGHRVRVVVEYLRSIQQSGPDSDEPRQHVTILSGKSNLAIDLVSAGLAKVLHLRKEDARSQHYDALVQAEQSAIQRQQGLHSKKPTPATRVIDLSDRVRTKLADASEDAASGADGKNKTVSAKAKTFFGTLSRESQVAAVVEFCLSGSRFKLFFPAHNLISVFSLSCIRTPQRPAAGQSDESNSAKWHSAALDFVRSRLLQHSVKVQLESQDKTDAFIGSLHYQSNSKQQNLAVQLVEEGLATVFDRAAERSEFGSELFAAQEAAKSQKRGLWADYKEPLISLTNDDGDDAVSSTEFINVRVTEIESVNDFYIHLTDDKQVPVIEEAMANFKETAEGLQPLVPSKTDMQGRGLVCAGLFTDGAWYRVKVTGRAGEEDYHVNFIDFGNQAVLSSAHLRALPDTLAKLPPLAKHASLAGLKAPTNPDYIDDAALAFNQHVWDLQLLAKVELADRLPSSSEKLLHLTLLHESSPVSINKQLLEAGWARVATRAPQKMRPLLEELKPFQETARRNHVGQFEYGDADEGSDTEDRPQGRRR